MVAKSISYPQLIFLGVADFLQPGKDPFPIGAVDLFQLSQHRAHIIYPGIIRNQEWVFLVNTELLANRDMIQWKLRIVDEDKAILGDVSFSEVPESENGKSTVSGLKPTLDIPIIKDTNFSLLYFKVDALIPHPGRYVIQYVYGSKSLKVGEAHFHYQKAPTLTPDQIKAIESNPESIKAIRMDLGCKFCPTKLKVYTGLKRQSSLEREGWVWQTDLQERFECQCGKTKYSLEYLKESMHGMLLKDFSRETSGLSYVRRYGHDQVVKVVKEFNQLLYTERHEQPIQTFIEKHPILLSGFHAKRLFVKPNIVGRFQADFAAVDSRDQLWLIELEKPSMKLFKKDGHPTATMNHAYEQVRDWLYQYAKYPGAILSSLSLKENDVVAVRGAVIAGRSTPAIREALQRHLFVPPYPDIEFMTLDDLANTLLQVSKKLA
jgi:hypothetical protein